MVCSDEAANIARLGRGHTGGCCHVVVVLLPIAFCFAYHGTGWSQESESQEAMQSESYGEVPYFPDSHSSGSEFRHDEPPPMDVLIQPEWTGRVFPASGDKGKVRFQLVPPESAIYGRNPKLRAARNLKRRDLAQINSRKRKRKSSKPEKKSQSPLNSPTGHR